MPNQFYLDNYHLASASSQAILSSNSNSSNASLEDLANTCLARTETLVPQWLPHGHREGDNWIAEDPVRLGYVIRVNLKTGAWISRPRRLMP